jgi:hypothetical protein
MPTNNQNLVEDNYIIEITSGVNAAISGIGIATTAIVARKPPIMLPINSAVSLPWLSVPAAIPKV